MSASNPGSPAAVFDEHRGWLEGALAAAARRGYWSPFPDLPAGEAAGIADVAAYFERDFLLQQPGARSWAATERSPWGVRTGVRYPICAPEALISASRAAERSWQAAGPRARVGVLLEAIARMHRRSAEIARAVMLTTGQGPVMAFQSGAAHAQDRALEAVACAWKLMSEIPAEAPWEKAQPGHPALSMVRQFDIVGRGVALVIGCATFPTWNTYPGLFAALATGNPVIVKPHPNAVLPAAISVAILREVLAESDLDPNTVTLAADPDPAATRALAVHPQVASIDFTGSNEFGRWLIDHARQARVYAEMAGINAVLVESTERYSGMLRNLASSLCLFSGQMCTAPQNIYVPRGGIDTDQGHKSFDRFTADLAAAVKGVLAFPKLAVEMLGAIGAPETLARLQAAARHGRTVLPSRALAHPDYPEAVLRTPLIVALDQADQRIYERECFGPISYVIAADTRDSAAESVEAVQSEHGALTLGLHSTDAEYIDRIVALSRRARTQLSITLTEGALMNHSAAFSDYHASGGNPAANASYCAPAFVADRFVVVQRRRHAGATVRR